MSASSAHQDGAAEPTPLLRHAGDLMDEIQDGQWGHALELRTQLTAENETIIAELRSRCPGFERTDYVRALSASRVRPPHPISERLRYGCVALTFLWGLFVVNALVKKIPLATEWRGLLAYPLTCGAAAVYLFRQKPRSRLLFIVLNLAAALAWIVFYVWAVRGLAANLWR